MSTKRNIARATVLILAVSIVSKVLGFAREMIIAAIFGTTYKADAYFIGVAGPDFIREIIAGGVLSAVFIPVYTSCLSASNEGEEKNYLNSITTLIGIVLIFFVLIGIPLAPYLVRAIAPELDSLTFGLAVKVTRVIFPAILFMGMASLYGSVLNVYKHFFAPSLNQLVLNIAIIAGVLLLGRQYGVESLAIGFLVGAILQFAVLITALRKNNVGYKVSIDWNSDAMKKTYRMWMPLFIALFVSNLNDLANRSIAAGLEAGNVAALTFANRIRETVWMLCGVPLGTAIFPYISLHAANNEKAELENLTNFALRITAFMAIPICLILLFYSVPIVKLLFQRGMFSENSTQMTSYALVFYSIGALFYAMNYIVLRVYFSIHDTIRPLKAFTAAFLVNIIGGVILRKYMAVGGVTLARSLADIITFVILVAGLSGICIELKPAAVYKGMLKMGAIAFASVAFSYLIFRVMPVGNTIIQQLMALVISLGLAFAGYIVLSMVFKVSEMVSFWNIVKKKMAI